MNCFFSGNYFADGGPWNVNKNLVACLDKDILVTTQQNKVLRFFEILLKIACAKVIVFSGVSSFDHIFVPFAHLLNRKIVYIMHGCLELEYKMNNNTTNPRGLKNEALLLRYSHLILCVSKSYSLMIKSIYPQYANKIGFLMNGVDWNQLDLIMNEKTTEPKDEKRIVLMGGGRTTKRNLQVCQAAERLNREYNWNLRVEVYGYHADFDDSKAISEIPCVDFKGFIPPVELLRRLKTSALFVQNSEYESFSLGVIEALCCGCSLLITPNVGAKDIIPGITNQDLIFNNMDVNEIMQKIKGVMSNPNNQRLLHSIDRDSSSIQQAARNLESVIKKL